MSSEQKQVFSLSEACNLETVWRLDKTEDGSSTKQKWKQLTNPDSLIEGERVVALNIAVRRCTPPHTTPLRTPCQLIPCDAGR